MRAEAYDVGTTKSFVDVFAECGAACRGGTDLDSTSLAALIRAAMYLSGQRARLDDDEDEDDDRPPSADVVKQRHERAFDLIRVRSRGTFRAHARRTASSRTRAVSSRTCSRPATMPCWLSTTA